MKHIDPDIKVYIRGKLTKIDGTALDDTYFTSITNNYLHFLFSQCTMSLNGNTITQATELYNYGSLPENLLTYSNDAATTHFTNAMWIIDDGNMAPCNPTAAYSTNNVFMTRWNLTYRYQEIELYGRIDTDFVTCLYIYYQALGYRSNSQRPRRVST
jgi:hypothetical protein